MAVPSVSSWPARDSVEIACLCLCLWLQLAVVGVKSLLPLLGFDHEMGPRDGTMASLDPKLSI